MYGVSTTVELKWTQPRYSTNWVAGGVEIDSEHLSICQSDDSGLISTAQPLYNMISYSQTTNPQQNIQMDMW